MPVDEWIKIVPGINFTKPVEEVAEALNFWVSVTLTTSRMFSSPARAYSYLKGVWDK